MPLLLIVLAFATIVVPIQGCDWRQHVSSVSAQTSAPGAASTGATSDRDTARPANPQVPAGRSSPVCDLLKRYPRPEGEKLGWEAGEIGALCRPFVKYQRKDLDRCGDQNSDPYSSSTTTSVEGMFEYSSSHAHDSVSSTSESAFTWATRNELAKKGKGNLYTDPDLQQQLPKLLRRVDEIRASATQLCCGPDQDCQKAMARVDVSLCKPNDDPDRPDPCVFGGSYRMGGDGYASIFRAVRRTYSSEEGREFRQVAEKNLSRSELSGGTTLPAGPVSGTIVLSSYVSKEVGAASLEPVIAHEFGHACSMIKMQHASIAGRNPMNMSRALRAVHWLDRARSRCQADLELPDAYEDFWESVGETRGLAQCLRNLTVANQKQMVDRPCNGLCPGHYLEESVGIAFSMLLGDLSGAPGAVFPNTCDHVRDGQHPMVSDVAECLVQNSPRFRDRLKKSYGCS